MPDPASDDGWPLPRVHIVTCDQRTTIRYERQPGANLIRVAHENAWTPDRETNPTCRMVCAPEPEAMTWLQTVAHPTTRIKPETATERVARLQHEADEARKRIRTDDETPRGTVGIELHGHWLKGKEKRRALHQAIDRTIATDGAEPQGWITLKSIGHHATEILANEELLERLLTAPETTFARTAGIADIHLTRYVTFDSSFA